MATLGAAIGACTGEGGKETGTSGEARLALAAKQGIRARRVAPEEMAAHFRGVELAREAYAQLPGSEASHELLAMKARIAGAEDGPRRTMLVGMYREMAGRLDPAEREAALHDLETAVTSAAAC